MAKYKGERSNRGLTASQVDVQLIVFSTPPSPLLPGTCAGFFRVTQAGSRLAPLGFLVVLCQLQSGLCFPVSETSLLPLLPLLPVLIPFVLVHFFL